MKTSQKWTKIDMDRLLRHLREDFHGPLPVLRRGQRHRSGTVAAGVQQLQLLPQPHGALPLRAAPQRRDERPEMQRVRHLEL